VALTTPGTMLNLSNRNLTTLAWRPVGTGVLVLGLHLLLGFALRSETARHSFQSDQAGESVLLILPVVVERFRRLPSIPDPIMRAPPLPRSTIPNVEFPSAPLDVMAVTIPSTDSPAAASEGPLHDLNTSEATGTRVRCPHKGVAAGRLERNSCDRIDTSTIP
jgi:hypothetical protein